MKPKGFSADQTVVSGVMALAGPLCSNTLRGLGSAPKNAALDHERRAPYEEKTRVAVLCKLLS